MRCELCGEEIRGRAYLGVVDRAELILCEKCVKRATKVYGPIGQRKPSQPKTVRRVPKSGQKIVEEIVDNFADIIKEARERAGLTKDALAAMTGVKVSVIRRIEEGTLVPPVNLARKLERILKVKLVEELIEESQPRSTGVGTRWEQTLGDVAVFKDEE